MSQDRDAFFGRMQSARGGGDAQRQEGFQSTTAKQILRHLAPAQLREMEQEARESQSRVSLDSLNQLHLDGAPLFLCAKVANTHKVTINDLYNRFQKTTIFRAYLDEVTSHDLDESNQAIAFVFNWTLAKHVMVMRNYPIGSLPGTCITHYSDQGQWSIESLKRLLQSIRHEQPEQ